MGGLDSRIDAKVNGKKKDCTCRECLQVVLFILTFIFAALATVLYFVYLNNAQEASLVIDDVEHRGNETTCMYSLDYNVTESSATCWYKASYEECNSSGSKGQRSCHTVPAAMECECPIKWSHANTVQDFLKVIPSSFDRDTNFDDANIKATEALQKYDVNLLSLCANAEVCHRFDCDDGGCCALEMHGHPEGLQDYCGDECYAHADHEFDCVTIDTPQNPGLLTLYGGTIDQMREWHEAHVNFFVLLVLILGSLGIASALLAGYCCVKNREYRKQNQSEL